MKGFLAENRAWSQSALRAPADLWYPRGDDSSLSHLQPTQPPDTTLHHPFTLSLSVSVSLMELMAFIKHANREWRTKMLHFHFPTIQKSILSANKTCKHYFNGSAMPFFVVIVSGLSGISHLGTKYKVQTGSWNFSQHGSASTSSVCWPQHPNT